MRFNFSSCSTAQFEKQRLCALTVVKLLSVVQRQGVMLNYFYTFMHGVGKKTDLLAGRQRSRPVYQVGVAAGTTAV